MPLDFVLSDAPLAFRSAENITLDDAAALLDITPISQNDLNAHKAAEIAKNPPHPLLAHRILIEQLLSTGLICFAAFGIVSLGWMINQATTNPTGNTVLFVAIGCVVEFVLAAACLRLANAKLRGPAVWYEMPGPINHVPTPIATLAWQLHRLVPEARFVIGTLIQDQVSLDPYLIMEHGWDRLVLGIWDEHGVIRVAEHAEH